VFVYGGEVLAFQGSLLSDPSPGLTGAPVSRRLLSRGAWVDHASDWLAGADTLFTRLVDELAWRHRRVWMYEREVVEPRLTAHLTGPVIDGFPVVAEIMAALGGRYGGTFTSSWLNLYRDGRDSVAWHGDRLGRLVDDTVVAILSLGEPRRFLMRPAAGGTSRAFNLGWGDLLVMGGSCQRTWQHAVPKTVLAGPRISVQFRPEVGEAEG
jgi:alkylated DNA repair dioxygenase AlkB